MAFFSVWLKHKVDRCIFFVVPGNCPDLLGMPDIELLGLLKITCKVLDQQVGRKCDSQSKRHLIPQTREQKEPALAIKVPPNNCINIPDYFRPSANKGADKSTSRLLTMKIHSGFSDVFTSFGCFKGHIQATDERRQPPISSPSQKGISCTPRTTIQRAIMTTKATNNSTP